MQRIDLKKWIHIVVTVLFFLGAFSLVAGAEEKQALVGKTVNINTASAEEFAKNVPLIDMELAKKIVEYREETGDFQVLQELLQIDGFSRTLLRKIKPFLLLEGLGGDDCTC
ncbi:MAG: helix-hairpin-helix domain-containing protein [Deltaproteobacteria bacterium]|nr:helix-hairpin-helix domain-containing protein [Deltaproteobacteria bacterium]MBW2307753.1 helix-hairpin-helix domain-containing protein [Deltaproteobacteria bacterium]